MCARLLLIAFAVLLCTIDVNASVHIWIETEHDELGARTDCEKRDDIAKRQVMLDRLERRLLEGIASNAELVAKYGAPKPLDIAKFVRPLGARLMVFPENIQSNEIAGLMERALYFELNDSCGMLVFVNPDGKPYLPAVLLWKVDDSLPKMTDVALCDKRLKWESTRLDLVLKITQIAKSDLMPSDEEMRRDKEATVHIQKCFDQLRRTRP